MCAILPHELFATLFNDYGPFWEKVMLGEKNVSEMSKFWAEAKTHACMQDCPAGLDLDRTVPLAVHGDEVPVVGRGKVWCKQALVVSWYSMWATHLNTKVALQKICTAFEAKTEALLACCVIFDTDQNMGENRRAKPCDASRHAVEPVFAGRNGSHMEGPGMVF